MPTNLRHTRLGGRVGSLYAATGGTPAAGSGASSLLTSLVSYWKLDEASGNATDAHGTNHLTDTNTVTTAAGKQGTSRQFTAANTEYFTIADNADLSTGDIDFTLAAWVYLDSSLGAETIVGKWQSGGNLEYWLGYIGASTAFAFQVSPDGTSNPSVTNVATAALATWYFVVAWHDSVANTINIQVDNGTVYSTAHTTGVFNGTAAFRIGYDGTWPMSGRVDEQGFWKRTLSAGERTTLYAGGAGVSYPTFA